MLQSADRRHIDICAALGCRDDEIVVNEEITDSKAIVGRLIELRKDKSLSQRKFAENIGQLIVWFPLYREVIRNLRIII